jgi:hypothetical protein
MVSIQSTDATLSTDHNCDWNDKPTDFFSGPLLSGLITDQQITIPEQAPEPQPEPEPVPDAEAKPVDAEEVDPREKLRERARKISVGLAEVMEELERLQADVDALQVQ